MLLTFSKCNKRCLYTGASVGKLRRLVGRVAHWLGMCTYFLHLFCMKTFSGALRETFVPLLSQEPPIVSRPPRSYRGCSVSENVGRNAASSMVRLGRTNSPSCRARGEFVSCYTYTRAVLYGFAKYLATLCGRLVTSVVCTKGKFVQCHFFIFNDVQRCYAAQGLACPRKVPEITKR